MDDREREGTRRTVIRVLSMLERSRAGLSVRAIADQVGVSKQTVERVLVDLGGTYPIVDEQDPGHAQRRLVRLQRGGPAESDAATLVVVLRVRRAAMPMVRASPLLRVVAVVAAREGDPRVRAAFASKEEVFRAVIALAPAVRIEEPRSLDDELRGLVMSVWE